MLNCGHPFGERFDITDENPILFYPDEPLNGMMLDEVALVGDCLIVVACLSFHFVQLLRLDPVGFVSIVVFDADSARTMFLFQRAPLGDGRKGRAETIFRVEWFLGIGIGRPIDLEVIDGEVVVFSKGGFHSAYPYIATGCDCQETILNIFNFFCVASIFSLWLL
jgi:hypothetical protein